MDQPHPTPPPLPGVSKELFQLLYDELREVAGRRMRQERADHSLRPTELVHEVFLRLSLDASLIIQNRAHFLGIAGRVMQQVLVDHARRRAAIKRGGDMIRVSFEEALSVTDDQSVEILELDHALQDLAVHDPVAAEVVTHRFFGGLTEVEIGELMGRTDRWVRQQWTYGRAWLRRELDRNRRG